MNRRGTGSAKCGRHVTCKSPSPVCNETGCPSACAEDTSGSSDPSASGAGCAVLSHGSGSGETAATDRPQTVGMGIASFSAPSLVLRACKRDGPASRRTHRRSGQMTGQTTPLAPTVNRPNLRDRAGLRARAAVPTRIPVQIDLFLPLQHAGLSRLQRGAPARGGGLLSVATPAPAVAPMEVSYGQQDAYRCHPPGGDPGRGGPRIPRRGI
ncbi:hypothetical protein BO1005MUT1_390138 [Hyphomicrobiales bacterium]|nr:hypothetical protein BO1005MUT1_390138 [Hyphomicrobiales bacterium]